MCPPLPFFQCLNVLRHGLEWYKRETLKCAAPNNLQSLLDMIAMVTDCIVIGLFTQPYFHGEHVNLIGLFVGLDFGK